MTFLEKIFGSDEGKKLKSLSFFVSQINSLEEELSKIKDADLKNKTLELKERIKQGEKEEDIIPMAFALVREASKRTLGLRHFDVQLLGGLILREGAIAEMKTGEGKTLVATLPVYLKALYGKGVHVVTVNDYLSKRDAVWMGQIYDLLGLKVSVIIHEQSFLYDKNVVSADDDIKRDNLGSFKVVENFLKPISRGEAYMADVTYGTNNEFGFDYLRDNIEVDRERLRQRDHFFAIIDEVDSILIDEARTPLIISAPTSEAEDLYKKFATIAKKMIKDVDFKVDLKFRTISLTDLGINKAENILGIENIYTEKGIKMVHHLETAVKAESLFLKDKDYVVKDNEIVIVDEFTGRLQPGRRWSEGLHQAIEAKENVSIQKESKTYASITFQNYFRMYEKISGMTGTAKTSKEEFMKVYSLPVYEVPTNKPILRIDKNDLIFRNEVGKFKAIAREIKERNKKGQPVLVGTVSIEKNELLSKFLEIEGVKHEVLNAKNHLKEGEIIAQAGKKGAVTIATNMAGRGVDIKLGGNPNTTESYEEVKSLGGLFVLGTERHDARRIDNQLRGRSGRQGDSGETQFFVSLEDHLMRVFGGDGVKNMMQKVGLADDEHIENKLLTKFIEQAQEKIEGFNFDARKHVLEYDDVLNYQRKIFYERRRKILIGNKTDIKDYISEVLSKYGEEDRKSFDLKMKENENAFLDALRMVILQTMDMFWVDHLDMMDYMRSSVNLRAYGQRDPLTEYKKEGLRLFKEMEFSIEDQILKIIPQINLNSIVLDSSRNTSNFIEGREENPRGKITSQKLAEENRIGQSSNEIFKEVGRNDPCPCGSGKKFKKCHGK